MPDVTHAFLSWGLGGLMGLAGLLQGWHALRALRTGVVKLSTNLEVERRTRPVGFRIVVAFHLVSALVLVALGSCLAGTR